MPNSHHIKRQTLISVHCADSDIAKTYPAVQMAINGCKSTTVREMVAIRGLDYFDMREHGFNLIGGTSNSMRFAIGALNLPSPDDLLEDFTALA